MNYIKPMHDYVLIQRIEEKQEGLIIQPDIAKEKGIKGKVLAVGPGKLIEGVNGGMVRRPLDVKPGDVVLFNSKWNDFAGDHYTTSSYVEATTNAEREKLHLVQEADIFLKLPNGSKNIQSSIGHAELPA